MANTYVLQSTPSLPTPLPSYYDPPGFQRQGYLVRQEELPSSVCASAVNFLPSPDYVPPDYKPLVGRDILYISQKFNVKDISYVNQNFIQTILHFHVTAGKRVKNKNFTTQQKKAILSISGTRSIAGI